MGNKKGSKFRITEPDQAWVEDNFKWLIEVYGYPFRQSEPITISDQYFPKTHSSNELSVPNLVDDLCNLIDLNPNRIKFEIHQDLGGSYEIPYEIQGDAFESELEISAKGNYRLHLAKSATQRPKRLIFNLIYEFIKMKLVEDELEFDTGEDTSLFIFIAGVFFGFGVLLAQNLIDIGQSTEGLMVTKWNYVSEMPIEVMAFALATYSKFFDQDKPQWKPQLPKDIRLQFESAMAFLNDSPSRLYDKTELQARDLFAQSDQEFQNGDFNLSLKTLQEILPLTADELLKADVYNNMGYCLLRMGAYEESVQNFLKALQWAPNYGFAHDNLGYALIQMGQLEKGRDQLEMALQTENNDHAYTYRNFALYYLARNELEQAESNFQMAFESQTTSVDLLELHYANFLMQQGELKKGMMYLKKAVEKGEHEALSRMNEIKNLTSSPDESLL